MYVCMFVCADTNLYCVVCMSSLPQRSSGRQERGKVERGGRSIVSMCVYVCLYTCFYSVGRNYLFLVCSACGLYMYTYVCMYVCMYEFYVCICVLLFRMYAWTYVCMYVCMYIFMYCCFEQAKSRVVAGEEEEEEVEPGNSVCAYFMYVCLCDSVFPPIILFPASV